MGRQLVWRVLGAIAAMVVLVDLLAITALNASHERREEVELAEGEYTIYKNYGGIGPIESEIFNFHETWTLSRNSTGDYEVEGLRSFECPKDFPREVRFWLHLSPKLQLVEAKEYTPLSWIRSSGPLACTFSPRSVRCSANGKDPANMPDLSVAVDKPYAFSWPLSAFSAAAVTRQADRRAGRVTEIQLVEIDQPGPSNPVMTVTGAGQLRFLGQEQLVIAGQTWQADKFELQASMPVAPRKSLLWVSATGLLLKIQAQRNGHPEGTLELSRFKEKAGLNVFR